jgi:fructose-bisphosphate aldolase class II
MTLVHTRQLFGDGTAVCAFNVITLEHAEAIAAGAAAAGRPCVLQISENTVRFHGGQLAPIATAAAAVAEAAAVDISLHLDHVESPDLLRRCAGYGFSSVMFDASRLPYAENVAATRQAVEFAHSHGLWLESELGEVGGKAGAHDPGARTDPEQANAFVAATGADLLAVAVGSRHAMVDRSATLDHALVAALARAVPVPLVLHGSSGVGDEELRRAVRAGLRKINIGTALNVALTARVRQVLGDAGVVDPRRYLGPARDAMAEAVAHFVSVVGPAAA